MSQLQGSSPPEDGRDEPSQRHARTDEQRAVADKQRNQAYAPAGVGAGDAASTLSSSPREPQDTSPPRDEKRTSGSPAITAELLKEESARAAAATEPPATHDTGDEVMSAAAKAAAPCASSSPTSKTTTATQMDEAADAAAFVTGIAAASAAPQPVKAASPSAPAPPRSPPSAASQLDESPSASASPAPASQTNTTTAEAAVKRWKENKEYLKLQRDMGRVLASMDRTPVADWATQASLLAQLQRIVQGAKDIVGAVELPDGDRFARSLWRAMSPQTVVGVQRKALEVLQSYLEYVNPAYPMTKDLPHFLPALLELLPQATMQVKSDVLELLDRAVVRRMPPIALRSCAEGLLAALLSCLEESETSAMYRRAMALLEYVHGTLQCDTSLDQRAGVLRGGQVLPAYTWLLVRDAASVRCPALLVMKRLIAQASLPVGGKAAVTCHSDETAGEEESALLSSPEQNSVPVSTTLPDWVGGDVQVVVSGLFNSLQDTQEKVHRLALDVLALVCPLGGRGVADAGGGGGAAAQTAVAAACLYESSVGISPAPSPTSSGPLTLPPPDSWATSSGGAAGGADFPAAAAQAELFSFEMKALLAAAAVQLLGTRHSTPSVTRRILQWLTVDPGCEAGEQSGQWSGAAEDAATAGDDASPSSSSSHAYVRDVTSFLLAQGFHMVVRHWQASWTNRVEEGGAADSRTPLAQRHLSSELSALQRTARSLVGAAAPRLQSATSIAAALSGGVGGGVTTAAAAGGEAITVTSSATSTAVGAVATPLVWLRALMLLFRYRSPSPGGAAAQAGDAGAGASPNTLDSPRHTVSDGASEPDTSSPFALYLVPLVLPSLSCLLEDVPSVLSRASLDSVKDARVPGNGKGINGSPEEEAWSAEVRALLRVLPWTGFAKLDVLGVQAVEKLVRPLLAETSRDGGNGGGVEPLQRRIQQYLHEAFTLARALEPSLMDATTEQPVAAQEYVGASLAWSDTVASLLSDVLDALTHAVTSSSVGAGLYIPLFVSTANGLLRLVVQRMQQLMEPMFDAVLATANATGTAVVGADFFASFVSAVDSGVLRRLREATVRTTQGLLFTPHSDSGTPVDNTSRTALYSLPDDQRAEVQKLLSRMHHTTLRFTAFLAQLHLRCQQHAVAGMLLDSASEDGAGSRERELARETASWLRCLCRACAAAACNAPLFFTRAVRLVLDVLLRARGSLLPAATYHMLEPNCLASGGLSDTVAFAEKFVLAPVVRSLWEGCRSVRDTAATASLALSSFASAADCCADTAGVCGASLLVLIAVSPACARCLDVCILESSVDAAVPRLVGLHRQLVDLRAQQRRGHVSSAAVPESAVVAELQDPGVLFLGLLTILSCVSVGSGGSDRDGAAESTRQLARAYLSHATVRDLSSVLLPLFFSFLCPLVLPIPPVTASKETGAGGATPHYASAGPAFSALTLTVLLPSSAHPGTKVRCADEAQRQEAARTYRTLEAAELVHHIFALLQLPTALAWLRQAMRTPTPNSLRVLLRGLEAQSFMAPDGRTSATAAALAREGPSDSLLAATALLLLNLSRQSLLSLHWSVVHRRDQAGGAGGGGVRGGLASASSGLGSPTHAEFPPPHHHSILLDALGCLNRMLEGCQTGPRTQPCRTAQHTWQFTAMQLLLLLRLAVQADLHTAQAMLLDHITGVVVYVDDVTASSSSSSSGAGATATVFGAPYLTAGGGGESGVTSRHWHPHALLRIGAAAAGHPDDALLLSGAPASEAHRSAATATTTTAAWVGESERPGCGCGGTPVTDDLQRAPPAVLSNKLLYAMIGEAVEHALGALCGTEEAAAVTGDHEVDTLVRWLRFYCDVLPYLYRELVPSSEVVLDVLLSALETTAPPCTLSTSSAAVEAAASAPRLPAALARVRCVCYATLAFLLRFLFSVARAADVENYEAAVKAKEAMSWIASTFSQEDPVARARSTTMWSRSPVLAPLRGALGRLVTAAVPGLCLGHTIHAPTTTHTQSGHVHASAQPFTWGYDADAEEEVAMGWRDGPRSPQPPPAGPTEETREPARQLLILLSHSAGPQFVTAFVEHWCGAHASSTALWVFETAGQRQCRLRQVQRSRGHHCLREEEEGEVRRTAVHEGSAGADAAVAAEVVRLRSAAWAAREVAQRAAGALLDDVGLSVAEVATTLGSLLREAIPKQLRSEQQSAQKSEEGSAARAGRGGGEGALTSLSTSLPPSHVAQVLYFLDTLVESVCTARPGGLTDRDAEAILALTSEVVSQGPPDSLAVCCVFHTVYCVIAYARGETGGTESERSNAVRGLSSSSPSPRTAASASKIYQSKDYSFTLCRLLEALSLNPAATHRSATLMLLQLLCQCFHAVLPSSLSWTDNPGRLVDAVTRVFQRTLLPTLRRGIASESEAEIVSNAPLVNACLRVLRAAINGFAPDQSFEKRVHRDIVTLVFSEHFFRYSRGSLHEWARLLRQLCAMDGDFHALMCERLVPSAGRLSTLMMSRETEALLRERALKCLAFYTYAVTATEDSPATSGATAASTGVATVVAAAAADNAGLGPAVSVVRHKELIHVLREQLTHTLQHFSPTTTPTVAEVDRKEVFVQPLRAAFFVFRVLLLCGIRESLAASLWPLVWPELLRALAIKPLPAVDSARSESAAVSVDAVQEVLRLQVEALKVLDADYTLYPAHAFSFRWLFTDDTALASVVALQQQQRYCRSRAVKKGVPHTPSPMSALLRAAVVRRVPLVSHLEVLHLLQKSPPVAAEVHFDPTSLIAAVHEPRVDPPCDEGSSEGLAPVLATIQRCWPLSARPSAGDGGLRRPLFNLPSTHYARLDGVHRAAQAFSLLLQRVNGEALAGDEDVQRLMLAQREVGECVGFHNEVDMAFMQDHVEADLTMTDPDTML